MSYAASHSSYSIHLLSLTKLLGQLLFVDELAELKPERRQCGQQISVRILHFVAKKTNHSQNFVTEHYWEADPSVKRQVSAYRASKKLRVKRDIRAPLGSA